MPCGESKSWLRCLNGFRPSRRKRTASTKLSPQPHTIAGSCLKEHSLYGSQKMFCFLTGDKDTKSSWSQIHPIKSRYRLHYSDTKIPLDWDLLLSKGHWPPPP